MALEEKKPNSSSVSDIVPKPDPNEEEMGIGTIFPGSTWDTFSFNQHKSMTKDGEIVVAISNRADAVPLANLVEMRRRDGQTRMLLNMMVLPIMAALKEAEWVEPGELGTDKENGPQDEKGKETPQDESGQKPAPIAKPKAGGAPALTQSSGAVGLAAPTEGLPAEDPNAPPDEGAAEKPGDGAEIPKAVKKKPVSVAEKETQFANDMFRLPPAAGGMTTPLSRVVKETLLGVLEGFSAFEEVRHVPDKGPLKGKITLRKLAHRDSRTLKFLVDRNGGFAGLRQLASRPDGTTVDVGIPSDKCWYWAAHEEENAFYGVSMFESSWYHYDIKTKLYYIAHLAAQFAAVPGRVGETPPGASLGQRNAFKIAIKNFAFNTAMTHPFGFKVTPFNGNAQFDFVKLIDHHSHLQAKSLLQGFADTEDRMVLIDNGKADASADMFVQALTGIMDEIAESWTLHLMPKYIDWNFGTAKYPVFRFGQLGDSSKDAIKDIFMTVVTSSVLNSTPEFVREMEKKLSKKLGLDIDYEEIERVEDLAAEAQAQQAEAETEAQAQQAEAQAAAEQQMAAQGGVPPAGGPPGAKPFGGAPGGFPPKKPAGGGFPPKKSMAAGPIAASATADIDEIVSMAQTLFTLRPESEVVGYEVDD